MMKVFKGLITVVIFTIVIGWTTSDKNSLQEDVKSKSREFHQLKTYILETEEQEIATDNFLQNEYLPALKRAGIVKVGVFKPIKKEKGQLGKIYVLIPLNSLDEILSLDEKLDNDLKYLNDGNTYLSASFDKPNYKRIESIILRAFINFPELQVPSFNTKRSERVYELRSYEASSERYHKNKVEMFNAGGEIDLFDNLGFNAVFYGEVISGAKMPNLMYMTTFETQESRDTHWNTFRTSPEWSVLKVKPQYLNNVSYVDKLFLYPTEYSDY